MTARVLGPGPRSPDPLMMPAFSCLLLLATSSVPQDSLDREELVAKARELVVKGGEADTFSGAVLLAHGTEVLMSLAVGEAEKGFHAKNDVETRFNLGSMNKMFTSVSIAQLAEKGRLSYDDRLSKYVDESWLPRDVTDRITVRHLLTHTSGLGSYFNDTYQRSSRELFRKVEDYKPLVRGETPAFEPGTRWSYSNTGMLLLGVVIEKVTGQDYFDYVREHVYAPAGMTRTDCYEMDQPVENLAIGYQRDPTSAQGWRNNLYMHVIKGGPAGGGFSTVGDLHRFAVALLEGKLVSVETLDMLWTDAKGAGYGFGFSVKDEPQKIVGHSGGFPGISSNLDVFVESGYVVAVLSNYGRSGGEMADSLRALVLRTSE
jgi:CubicO group peptidase (beta-lactamase class C family)